MVIPAGEGKIASPFLQCIIFMDCVLALVCEPLGRKALVELVAAAAVAVELAVSVHSSPASSTSDISSPELILIISQNIFNIYIIN